MLSSNSLLHLKHNSTIEKSLEMQRSFKVVWSTRMTPFLKYTSARAEASQRIIEFDLTAKESLQSLARPDNPDTHLWFYNE